jgi:protein-disulfide isomerase
MHGDKQDDNQSDPSAGGQLGRAVDSCSLGAVFGAAGGRRNIGKRFAPAAEGASRFRMAQAVMRFGGAGLVLGILLVAPQTVLAGELSREPTRDDLVAALEHGAGPSKGPANAPIIMVGFSDFQCSYCRKFWHETFPQIEADYIRPGKMRFVYRHLAILGGPSLLAAQAATCADDQGSFWQYHEALFGSMAPFLLTASRLKQIAARLGLDRKSFDVCLDSRRYAERIETETLLAHALGATGTPAFLINGQLLIGAYPFQAFQKQLDVLLAGPQRQPQRPTR